MRPLPFRWERGEGRTQGSLALGKWRTRGIRLGTNYFQIVPFSIFLLSVSETKQVAKIKLADMIYETGRNKGNSCIFYYCCYTICPESCELGKRDLGTDKTPLFRFAVNVLRRRRHLKIFLGRERGETVLLQITVGHCAIIPHPQKISRCSLVYYPWKI